MILECLAENFSVCKLENTTAVDLEVPFTFLSVTDDEISLVCPSGSLPPNITHIERDWKAFKIQGKLDFGLIGIIASISQLFAKNQISIFVISTYNTDYILVKEPQYAKAMDLLRAHSYKLVLAPT